MPNAALCMMVDTLPFMYKSTGVLILVFGIIGATLMAYDEFVMTDRLAHITGAEYDIQITPLGEFVRVDVELEGVSIEHPMLLIDGLIYSNACEEGMCFMIPAAATDELPGGLVVGDDFFAALCLICTPIFIFDTGVAVTPHDVFGNIFFNIGFVLLWILGPLVAVAEAMAMRHGQPSIVSRTILRLVRRGAGSRADTGAE